MAGVVVVVVVVVGETEGVLLLVVVSGPCEICKRQARRRQKGLLPSGGVVVIAG